MTLTQCKAVIASYNKQVELCEKRLATAEELEAPAIEIALHRDNLDRALNYREHVRSTKLSDFA